MRKLITSFTNLTAIASLLFFVEKGFAQTISGNVYQDFNFDGIDNDNGNGLPGIRIYVFDAIGLVDSTTTDALGNFTISGLTNGTRYRLEFHPLAQQKGLQSGFFGMESGTTVQFVTAPASGVSQGFALPTDFCQSTPILVTPCYTNGDPLAGGTAGNSITLVGFPENATGTGQTANINMANGATVGACWGVCYQRSSKIMFTSAVLRRHSGFGPGGPGAIYVFDATVPANPVPLPTIDLSTLGIPVGTDPRSSEPLPADILTPNFDSTSFPIIGKMSLGDLDISEDGRYLYVMNLFNRTLYRIFIDNPFQPPTAADVTAFPLTNPGCGADGDWRPWAIKVYRGDVYVGVVCTAESTQQFNQLHAYVQKLNSGGTFDAVLDFPLTFTRGNTIIGVPVNTWNPWTNNWNTIIATGNGNYPTPLLSDIEFDINGAMILGFLDRTAMQGGYLNYGPGQTFSSPTTTFSGGDILRACPDGAGGFVLEGAVGCTTAGGMGNGQGPGGSEYYWEETFENSVSNAGTPFVIHAETALGGLVLISGKGEVVTNCYDPYTFNTGGILWLDNGDGTANQAYEIFPPLFGYSGKSAGLGDVEALCEPAPLELGNFVWKDSNQNGIQDPHEEPIEGVNVSLIQSVGGNCVTLATVQTNADGEYYFNSYTTGISELLPNTEYHIAVGTGGQFNPSTLQLFDSLSLTVVNTGTWLHPDWNDSDGLLTSAPPCLQNIPHITVLTGDAGQVEHTYDFGFFVGATSPTCDIAFSNFTFQNETCFGYKNGTATATATSTLGAVEYALNNGAFSPQNSWTNLAGGTYTISARVIADTSCRLDSTFIIFQGPTATITGFTTENETCEGSADGTISVSAIGVGGVEYSLNGSPFSSQNFWDNLAPSSYTVVVRLANNPECTVSQDFTIHPGPRIEPATSVAHYDICQFEDVPAGEGLAATCAPCPAGLEEYITWWDAPQNGNQVGSGQIFNPVSAQLVSNAVVGSTTFWVQCECGVCVSERTEVVFTVHPLPQPHITGELFPCPGSTHTYTTPFQPGSSWTWTLSGGGQIIAQNQNQITIRWTGDPGVNFILQVSETDVKGCINTDEIAVCIRSTVLVCDDIVHVSLQDSCKFTLQLDNLLEGTYKTFEGYTIMVTPLTPGTTAMGNMIFGKGEFLYKVVDPCVGNACWGKILAEDKTPPRLQCRPKEVTCSHLDTAAVIPDLSGMPTEVIIGGLNDVTITDGCGIIKVTYTDQYTELDCPDDFTGRIEREWQAIDMSGNIGTCTQVIQVRDGHLKDVIFPADKIYSCDNPNVDPRRTGAPTLDGYPIYPTSMFCKLKANYQDEKIRICDGSFKILRRWSVFDWCVPLNEPGSPTFQPQLPANPRTHLQIIKVEDKTPPAFTCPGSMQAMIDPFSCTGYVDLPDVVVTDACSRLAVAVAKLSGNRLISGTLTSFPGNNLWLPDTLASFPLVDQLPDGDHVVQYTISDDCGNSQTCSFVIQVSDDIPPTAVCIENSKISLGQDGWVNMLASALNNGSHDNCGSVYFKARRMDGGAPCSGLISPFFDDKVAFCCDDVGTTQTVVLRVYDQPIEPGLVADTYLSGRFNDCMVQVKVEDKLRPVCIAPADVTVSCSAFDPSLWAYGTPVAVDNCIMDTVTVHIDYHQFDTLCKKGTLRRIFTVTDAFGNWSRCTQRITVQYNTNYKVTFPDDVVAHSCNASGGFGEPIFVGKDCEMAAVSYHDQIFTLVPDACYKILRTWRVADWCNYDIHAQPIIIPNPVHTNVGQVIQADYFNRGYFQYTQVISVLDNVKPEIISCPASPVIIEDVTDNDPSLWHKMNYWDDKHRTHDLCEAPVPTTIRATDACSGANLTISFSIQLDVNSDGKLDVTLLSGQPGSPELLETIEGNERIAMLHPNAQLPHGKHKMTWMVRDGCGNETQCHYQLIIRDGKAPTVVCHNGLAVNIMPTKMIQMRAVDFVKQLSDNCTPVSQLVLAIRKSGAGVGFPTDSAGNALQDLTFTCDHLGTNVVEVWARDKTGMAASCATYLIVQDNGNNCSNTTAQVAGSLETEDVEPISKVRVKISGASNAFPPPSYFTNNDGKYHFNAIPLGDDYLIESQRNDNWLNGVTTYDLLLISRHINGVKPFSSPYQTIAADANRSGTVTANDIVQLRKLILGIIDTIAGNTSWRFVPRSFQFANPQNPWQGTGFPEKIGLRQLKTDYFKGDFIGIKVGDVNNNSIAHAQSGADDRQKSYGTLFFDIENRPLQVGDTVAVKITSTDLARVLAYQFTLVFDPSVLECFDLTMGNLPDLSAEHFGTHRLSDGILTASYFTHQTLTGNKDIVTLHFKAKKAGTLSDWLCLSHSITPTEAYSPHGEPIEVKLRFSGTDQPRVASVGFELYQNKPNPFDERTQIGFFLPEAGAATLTLFDGQGKLLLTRHANFERGFQTFEVDRSQIGSAAIIFYQVETPFGRDVKKMIFIRQGE